jgi:hypothetical protein
MKIGMANIVYNVTGLRRMLSFKVGSSIPLRGITTGKSQRKTVRNSGGTSTTTSGHEEQGIALVEMVILVFHQFPNGLCVGSPPACLWCCQEPRALQFPVSEQSLLFLRRGKRVKPT